MRTASLVALTASLASLWTIATAASASKGKVLAADDPDDPNGKTLYITEPACGYYRCIVDWAVGSPVAVNWLGPPAGNVAVSLASNIGGPTYNIIDSIASVSQEGYCDSGYGMGVVAPGHECGRVEFVVPLGWKRMDNYTIVVQSLSDESLIGYTDMITITGPNKTTTVDDPPSGTAVSLLTIADPTATNRAASTKWTGRIPAATAVTGAASSASSARVRTTVESVASSSAAPNTMSLATVVSTAASSDAAPSVSGTVSRAGAAASPSATTSQTAGAPAGAVLGKAAAALGAVAAAAVLAL
ncbi:hypothetical protein JCM10207_002651 [Rhodosporidiobolus poonsookiae]